jgi:hypothetical protein
MPNYDEQKRLVPAFTALNRLRAAQESRTADLAALMPSLLDRAFKGEL